MNDRLIATAFPFPVAEITPKQEGTFIKLMTDETIISAGKRKIFQTALYELTGVHDDDNVIANALLNEGKAIAKDGLLDDTDAALARLHGVLSRFGLKVEKSRVQ